MAMTDSLSILYVAYPLLRVSPESAGGAEQMLLTVERTMASAGHGTAVAACNGSQVSGHLLATGTPANGPDQYECREREHNARILSYLRQHPGKFDLVHDKSGSFFRQASECPVPVLATLHLPRIFYREEWFRRLPPNLFFNCVSRSQAKTFEDLPGVLGVIENGIEVEEFPFVPRKDDYLLWLGRICDEKAPHLAIAAAQQAGLPLVLAGQVYPFRYHQDYFDREIRPHLFEGSLVRFISTPALRQKLDLLSHAHALLLTSTAEETSSLVAMEAMACGTPVVAFRRGAFPEIVAHSETGFVVDRVEEMADAVGDVGHLGSACRLRVESHFNARRMGQAYEEVYRQIAAIRRKRAA